MWIKYNAIDDMVTLGDVTSPDDPSDNGFRRPKYLDRGSNFKKDNRPGGTQTDVPPADAGFDGYTYVQGVGLFRWRDGFKEFVSAGFAPGDDIISRRPAIVQEKRDRTPPGDFIPEDPGRPGGPPDPRPRGR